MVSIEGILQRVPKILNINGGFVGHHGITPAAIVSKTTAAPASERDGKMGNGLFHNHLKFVTKFV